MSRSVASNTDGANTNLPPGQYEVVEHGTTLSPEDEAALEEAFEELDRGERIPHEEVMRGLREKLLRK